MKKLKALTSIILDTQQPIYALWPEVVEIIQILADAQTIWSKRRENIADGETTTPNGLAISPTMAALCADDYVRTITFIRGVHDAIVDRRTQYPDRPVRVLYAGCGPYAPLAIPLMTIFAPTETLFTLLDIHADSIASIQSIIENLGLSSSVAGYETVDAASYPISPERPPDVIILEIMRACLEVEPQVAVTRKLLAQAPDAVLVPEEVRIDLMLVDPSREVQRDTTEDESNNRGRNRIPVGTVMSLNQETVREWEGDHGLRLQVSSVRLPDVVEEQYQPMLFTIIRTYENHVIENYDSGLTFPRTPTLEGKLRPGRVIQFYYEFGLRPQLIGEIVDNSPADGERTNRDDDSGSV